MLSYKKDIISKKKYESISKHLLEIKKLFMDGLIQMKRVNNTYYKICDIDVIMNMYDKVTKTNTRNKYKIEKFNNFYSINIVKIKDILSSKKYIPIRYNIFLIREHKV